MWMARSCTDQSEVTPFNRLDINAPPSLLREFVGDRVDLGIIGTYIDPELCIMMHARCYGPPEKYIPLRLCVAYHSYLLRDEAGNPAGP
jgi:hypothetical protein